MRRTQMEGLDHHLKYVLRSVDLERTNSDCCSVLTGLLLRGGKVGGGARTGAGRSPRPTPSDSVLKEKPVPRPRPAGILCNRKYNVDC